MDLTFLNTNAPKMAQNFATLSSCQLMVVLSRYSVQLTSNNIPYPTVFPYGNGMVLHFYQQQESSTTKTVHRVINKALKAYV